MTTKGRNKFTSCLRERGGRGLLRKRPWELLLFMILSKNIYPLVTNHRAPLVSAAGDVMTVCVQSDASPRDHDKSPRRVIGLKWYWHQWWISLISLWLASECWGRQRFEWWELSTSWLVRVHWQLSVDWLACSPDIHPWKCFGSTLYYVLVGIFPPISMTALDALWLPRVSMYCNFDVPVREVLKWNIASTVLFWRVWRMQRKGRRTLLISYPLELLSLSWDVKKSAQGLS